MTSTQPSTSDSVLRRRRWIPWLVLAVLIGVLLAVQAHMVHRLTTARGDFTGTHSLDLGSYLPPPELAPDAVNASDFIEAAALLTEGQGVVGHAPRRAPSSDLAEIQHAYRLAELRRQPLSPEDFQRVQEATQRHALALEVLEEGLDNATDSRYATDYSLRPFAIIVPELLVRLRFAVLLRGRAELAVADGRFDDAWQDARRIFQLAHWSSDDLPILINALVARAIHHQGYLLTQRLYGEAPVSAELRQQTLDWAVRTPVEEMLNRLFAGERAVGLDHILSPETPWDEMDSQLAAPFWQKLLFRWSAWRSLNGAVYLEKATPIFEASLEPAYGRRGDNDPDALSRPPEWAWLAKEQFFGWDGVADKRDLWLAARHHLELAEELEAIREGTGSYPAVFDVQAIDPFSGEPHVYRRTADGYEIYSFSVNGVDDGGQLPTAQPSGVPDWNHGDLIWRVERGQGEP